MLQILNSSVRRQRKYLSADSSVQKLSICNNVKFRSGFFIRLPGRAVNTWLKFISFLDRIFGGIVFETILKKTMRVIGIILLVVGILMIIFTRVNFTTEKKVIDAGPVEVNKEEHHSVDWPTYAGVGVIIIGGLVVYSTRKRNL